MSSIVLPRVCSGYYVLYISSRGASCGSCCKLSKPVREACVTREYPPRNRAPCGGCTLKRSPGVGALDAVRSFAKFPPSSRIAKQIRTLFPTSILQELYEKWRACGVTAAEIRRTSPPGLGISDTMGSVISRVASSGACRPFVR